MNILKKIWQFMNPFYDPEFDKLMDDMKQHIKDLEANKLVLEHMNQQALQALENVKDGGIPMTKANNENMPVVVPQPDPPINLAAEVNIEIPEFMIQQAAMAIGGDNNFAKLLINGDAYRVANLTPVYLTNQSQTVLRVSAKEYFENPRILN